LKDPLTFLILDILAIVSNGYRQINVLLKIFLRIPKSESLLSHFVIGEEDD
jgi:hypothetical protein